MTLVSECRKTCYEHILLERLTASDPELYNSCLCLQYVYTLLKQHNVTSFHQRKISVGFVRSILSSETGDGAAFTFQSILDANCHNCVLSGVYFGIFLAV